MLVRPSVPTRQPWFRSTCFQIILSSSPACLLPEIGSFLSAFLSFCLLRVMDAFNLSSPCRCPLPLGREWGGQKSEPVL
jgi:hypothetical protein